MNTQRRSGMDRAIDELDQALRTLCPAATGRGGRPAPAADSGESDAGLDSAEQRLAAGLMRVNHSGEVCAQALYRGQAATSASQRDALLRAAREEGDHLAWCEQSLAALHSAPSHLNPIWYALSWGMGAAAGCLPTALGLGFIAATEEQVSEHLREHLKRLPPAAHSSRAIVERMLTEETGHGADALSRGGQLPPVPLRRAMRSCAKLMTGSSRWL